MTNRTSPAETRPILKQMNYSSINSTRVTGIIFFVLLFGCGLGVESNAQSTRQKQQPNDKPWQEFASTEGRFSVFMPETPEEHLVPVTRQTFSTEVHAYLLRTDVAYYAVLYNDLPEERDPDLMKTMFEVGADDLVARLNQSLGTASVRLVSDKDISSRNIVGREVVADAGAYVIKSKLYYRNGRLYQVVFAWPQLNGMSAEMVKFYDGLSAKFFSSFKIKT
jgi:hypothetical protein